VPAELSWSVRVAVPPGQAYDYVADLTRHPEWGMEDMAVEPREPGAAVRVGSRFEAQGTLFGRRQSSELTVTRLDRPRALEFAVHDRQGETHHAFTFTAVDGGTEITRRLRASRQPWHGPLRAWLLRGATNKSYQGALAKLKFMLEAAPKGRPPSA
jgi:uncharacterized protein YndB with AHSA1/START domain